MKPIEKKRDWDGDPLTKAIGSIKLSSKDTSSRHDFHLYGKDKKKPLSPRVPKKYSLREMLKKITKDNLHPETDWGPPVGREII